MAKQIVECVPNFSEGRDKDKIKQITDAIEAVSGVQLLNVDPGADTNRTVVTFIGSPEAVSEAAFRGIEKAAQVIDMRTQKGAHPRIGATDVVPFVPVENVTMEECVALAHKLGARVGSELDIPVFFYEEAAKSCERKNLADIRKGEYEGLEQKLQDLKWKPDCGPARFNSRAGATVIGAREFLIAYNVTLNSWDKNHAQDIAFALRQKGRTARVGNITPYYFKGEQLFYREGAFPCGTCGHVAKSSTDIVSHCSSAHGYDLVALLKDNDVNSSNLVGQKVYVPGAFSFCKAIGWYVEEFKRAQVSINLTNYRVTPPHAVLEEARRLASERGLAVTGSEIVGLIPYQALMESGKYYLRKQGASSGVPAVDVLRTAVFSMGLADVSAFDIRSKVLGLPEYGDKALVSMKISDFVDEVSRDTPAPGGGSIAALSGSLGAALASMVANLTHGKPGSEAKDARLCELAERAQKIKDELLRAVDDDTNAFNAYMEARRLPNVTPQEKAVRLQKMQEGLKIAVDVPLRTAVLSFEAMEVSHEVSLIGNPNSLTDAAVGVQMGMAGVRGGLWNVMINLKDITDSAYSTSMREKCQDVLARAQELSRSSATHVDGRLAEMIAKAQSK